MLLMLECSVLFSPALSLWEVRPLIISTLIQVPETLIRSALTISDANSYDGIELTSALATGYFKNNSRPFSTLFSARKFI